MSGSWESRAALYELLARTFLFTEREVSDALVSGEYADAVAELAVAVGLGSEVACEARTALEPYRGADADRVFHDLRREYTRLYVGSKEPPITPYAGVWSAKRKGILPLLFVGRESMEIERFMRGFGMKKAGSSNDPMDHIGSMLEFLMHLCSVKAGIVEPSNGAEAAEGAYAEFYGRHFVDFAHAFAGETIQLGNEPFFVVGARLLGALPSDPL